MNRLALLGDALPFMATMSPVVGVLSTAVVSRWNGSLVKPMAVSNAALTLVLACLMACNYDPRRLDHRGNLDVSQMEVRLNWLSLEPLSPTSVDTAPARGVDVRLAFGIDGVTLWPVVWIALAAWGALCFPGRKAAAEATSYSTGLLIAEAGLLAACTSRDAISSLIFFQVAMLPLCFLIGRFGEGERRLTAERFLIQQLVGCGLTLLGTTLIAVAWPWMQSDLTTQRSSLSFGLPELVDRVQALLARSEIAVQVWDDVSAWGWLLLVTGFAVSLSLFPLHVLFARTLIAAPAGVAGLLAVSVPQVVLAGWLRFIQPLFPTETFSLSGLLGIVAMLGMLHAALEMMTHSNLGALAAALSTTWTSLAFLGARIPLREGLLGTWLFLQFQVLVVMALFLFLGMLEARPDPTSNNTSEGRRRPPLRLAAMLTVLLIGVVAGTFNAPVGSHLMASTLTMERLLLAVCAIAANLLLLWSAIMVFQPLLFPFVVRFPLPMPAAAEMRLARSTSSQQEPRATASNVNVMEDLSWRECLGLAPFALLPLFLALAPGIVGWKAESTVAHLVQRLEKRMTLPSESETPVP